MPKTSSKEQPRERLAEVGSENLTISELIALIIRTGTKDLSPTALADTIISTIGNTKQLANVTLQELANFKGIGHTKAASIKAAIELGLRLANQQDELVQLFTPKETYNHIKHRLFAKPEEYLYLLSLDSRNKLIATDLITKGTVRESLVNPREIYKKSLQRNAVFIILAHNHPSNDVSPSKEDIEVTKKVMEAGKLIGIPLLDHLIVGDKEYTSLKSYV